MWKEVVMVCFEAGMEFAWGTEENYNKLQSGYLVSQSRFVPDTSKIQVRRVTP
jgi:hypothetical protein